MSTTDFITRTTAIGDIGGAFYFDKATVATGKEHDLDGFRFYFLGRGGVLGDVEAEVVHSAFGYFERGLITKMWDTAKARMAPRDAARLYLSCAHDFARARFGSIDGLDAFCAAAEQVNDAIEPAALALYAGIDAEPLPDDLPARAMQLCSVLREARGSTHLLAIVASGLTPYTAHAVKRPTEMTGFGWPEEVTVSDEDRVRWQEAEALTDRLLEPAFGTLDDAGRSALLAGLTAMRAAL